MRAFSALREKSKVVHLVHISLTEWIRIRTTEFSCKNIQNLSYFFWKISSKDASPIVWLILCCSYLLIVTELCFNVKSILTSTYNHCIFQVWSFEIKTASALINLLVSNLKEPKKFVISSHYKVNVDIFKFNPRPTNSSM